MNITRRSLALGGMGLLAGVAATRPTFAQDSFLGVGQGLEDFWLASDAYIFGYPLVTMEFTRRVMTNTAAPLISTAAATWGNNRRQRRASSGRTSSASGGVRSSFKVSKKPVSVKNRVTLCPLLSASRSSNPRR